MCCRAGMTRCDTFYQFYCKVMAEWSWWYRSRSLCGTHPLLVPNMDGQTDGVKPIDPDSITQENIDFIYGKIQAVLHNSAFACEALRIENNNSKRTPRKRSKPWWNDDCEIHRNKFNHARRKYANDNSNEMRVWKISEEKLIKYRSTQLSPNLIKILIKSYVFYKAKILGSIGRSSIMQMGVLLLYRNQAVRFSQNISKIWTRASIQSNHLILITFP